MSRLRVAALAATIASPAVASAQPIQAGSAPLVSPEPPSPSNRPIGRRERREWVIEGILAPGNIGAGVMIGTWQTAMSSPREWQGSAGFTRRVLTNEADNAISKGIEGSLGALWGEDPRSLRSSRRGLGPRVGHAMTTVLLAPRPDGRLAPAWGRFAGAVGSNLAKNAWLPSRLTTPKETAMRVGGALLGRLATNLWHEFGPDLRRRFGRNGTRPPMPRRPGDRVPGRAAAAPPE